MTWTSVVFLEDRVMNDSGWHLSNIANSNGHSAVGGGLWAVLSQQSTVAGVISQNLPRTIAPSLGAAHCSLFLSCLNLNSPSTA